MEFLPFLAAAVLICKKVYDFHCYEKNYQQDLLTPSPILSGRSSTGKNAESFRFWTQNAREYEKFVRDQASMGGTYVNSSFCFECGISNETRINIPSISNEVDLQSRCDHFPYINPILINTEKLFVKWCYRISLHRDETDIHAILITQPDLLQRCIAYQEKYPVIGAAILAEDVTIEGKRKFIEKLLFHGFILTVGDVSLAMLTLYDELPKTKIMLFLQSSIVTEDVKWHIVHLILQIYKISYYPLPI